MPNVFIVFIDEKRARESRDGEDSEQTKFGTEGDGADINDGKVG
jgi:hypothetical protein